ncbi:MAG: hypothetical protein WBW60_22780, partial [Candidatus Sulfotelmatobacter sp.]
SHVSRLPLLAGEWPFQPPDLDSHRVVQREDSKDGIRDGPSFSSTTLLVPNFFEQTFRKETIRA